MSLEEGAACCSYLELFYTFNLTFLMQGPNTQQAVAAAAASILVQVYTRRGDKARQVWQCACQYDRGSRTSGTTFIPGRVAHIIGNYHEIIEHHGPQV
jgi:hypothetical protein